MPYSYDIAWIDMNMASNIWVMLDTIGNYGSESSIIIFDEEIKGRARITLEKCKKYYAVTVGIYGVMMHTAFYGNDIYHECYQQMKKDIQCFVERDATEDGDIEFYEYFTSQY